MQRLAVWLLLLALPLQGLAMHALSTDCIGHPSGSAVSASQDLHGHGHVHGTAASGHDHPASADQNQDENPPADQAGSHSSCHHAFSAAPSASMTGIPAAPRVVNMRVSLLTTLHFPELPQRPPRA